MQFTKVHGAGNDFALIDIRNAPPHDYNRLAPVLCHRQTGIGADGLLLLDHSNIADIRMRIVNYDGSEAEMCGNGIRAFARYVYERGILPGVEFSIETLAGIMRPKVVLDENGKVTGVRVDMGKPGVLCADVPVVGEGHCLGRTLEVLGKTFTFSSARTGVPVTAVPVDDPKTFDLYTYGPAIENHPFFPERTNVCFFRVIDRHTVEMRVWERGAGATLACGTGSCGTAVLCAMNGLTERSVDIQLELATVHIDWEADNTVYMTGPAAIVFDGEYLDKTV
ncbi:diaminopimelate epimerase [Christensenellaceae bacterium OttesenSCG-928-L17]|nr:diaminopimelate epimerase [Christensenellaceae bacterium OttesenSCG-928-L17]